MAIKPKRPRGGALPPVSAASGYKAPSGNGDSKGVFYLTLAGVLLALVIAIVTVTTFFNRLEGRVSKLEEANGAFFETRIEAYLSSKKQPETANGAISKEQLTSLLQNALDCERNDKTYDPATLTCTSAPRPPEAAVTPAEK